MKKLSFPIVLLCFLVGCNTKSNINSEEASEAVIPTEVEELVQTALNFHDPQNIFNKTTIVCEIHSTTPKDSVERLRNVQFNTLKDSFEMTQTKNGAIDKYTVPIPTEVQDSTKIARSNMYKNYFRYMLGGAMVLADKSAQIQEEVKDTLLLNNIPAKQIKVIYEPVEETPVWYFTFNTETGEMLQNKFVYNEGQPDQRGEFINYGPYVDYKGMKIPSKIEWFYLNGDLLATENITYLD